MKLIIDSRSVGDGCPNATAIAAFQDGLSDDGDQAAVHCSVSTAAAAAAVDVAPKQKSPFGVFIDDTLADAGSIVNDDDDNDDDDNDDDEEENGNIRHAVDYHFHFTYVMIGDEIITGRHGNQIILDDNNGDNNDVNNDEATTSSSGKEVVTDIVSVIEQSDA